MRSHGLRLPAADGTTPSAAGLARPPDGYGPPVLYLAWEESQSVEADAVGPWEAVLVLRPGLLVIDSEVGRSPVYHALKDLLPPETPLVVAPVDGLPKLSRMPAGSTRWLRRHGRPAGG